MSEEKETFSAELDFYLLLWGTALFCTLSYDIFQGREEKEWTWVPAPTPYFNLSLKLTSGTHLFMLFSSMILQTTAVTIP